MPGPQRIADVLAQLMARRGFARVRGAEAYASAWNEASGPLGAQYSRVGQLKRGTLEIVVANSTLIQEFTFQKSTILGTLNRLLPDHHIKDLRFRLGAIQ
jgi:predicted nucleic acid-binding Zn ribbon protein